MSEPTTIERRRRVLVEGVNRPPEEARPRIPDPVPTAVQIEGFATYDELYRCLTEMAAIFVQVAPGQFKACGYLREINVSSERIDVTSFGDVETQYLRGLTHVDGRVDFQLAQNERPEDGRRRR